MLFENLLKVCAWAIIIVYITSLCNSWMYTSKRLKRLTVMFAVVDQPVHKLRSLKATAGRPVINQLRGYGFFYLCWVHILVDNGSLMSSAYSSIVYLYSPSPTPLYLYTLVLHVLLLLLPLLLDVTELFTDSMFFWVSITGNLSLLAKPLTLSFFSLMSLVLSHFVFWIFSVSCRAGNVMFNLVRLINQRWLWCWPAWSISMTNPTAVRERYAKRLHRRSLFLLDVPSPDFSGFKLTHSHVTYPLSISYSLFCTVWY